MVLLATLPREAFAVRSSRSLRIDLTMLSFLWLVLATARGLGHAATISGGPVIYEDLADLDVFRVNNTYYYTASTMHYSPGVPILESTDLVDLGVYRPCRSVA